MKKARNWYFINSKIANDYIYRIVGFVRSQPSRNYKLLAWLLWRKRRYLAIYIVPYRTVKQTYLTEIRKPKGMLQTHHTYNLNCDANIQSVWKENNLETLHMSGARVNSRDIKQLFCKFLNAPPVILNMLKQRVNSATYTWTGSAMIAR